MDKTLQEQLFYKDEIEHGLSLFKEQINRYVPDGREKSLAITNAEQAAMWANKAIFKS